MVRLGRISYVNMAPVFHRLDAEVEEISGVPTELARALLAGEVDVAPIPSIEWARNADRLKLLPRLCVSSEGAVDSIQLVSSVPLERIRRVAVTPESATSVVLARVLLPGAEQVPLDEEAILGSARKTSKILVIDEANRTCAAGAEVAALIGEQAFEDLDAPVRRLATPDVPIPFSPPLERAVLPGIETVKEACRELLEY